MALYNKGPLGKDTSNIAAYFPDTTSVMKSMYKLFVILIVDSLIYLVKAPLGQVIADSRAFHGTSLSYILQDIPYGFYLVGVSAYALSSSLLVPYTGSDKKIPEKDVLGLKVDSVVDKMV